MARPLAGKVCIVTGASRGIGRGIALQLGKAGATVYITGRTLGSKDGTSGSLLETAAGIEARGGRGIAIECDHSKDEDIKRLFRQVSEEQDGCLDVLVNNAYSGVYSIFSNLDKTFWEQDESMWDDVNNVGLRNHYICLVHAARMMVPRKTGLIINVSSPGGLKYLFNVAYGVGKEACDRMAVDCAHELRKHNVACVSLWPGGVKTEQIQHFAKSDELQGKNKAMMENISQIGESVEYPGKCVAHLASDPDIMNKSGRILLTQDLGDEYGFTDIDGKKPSNFRSIKTLLLMTGHTYIAQFTPSFIKLPFWLYALGGNKF